MTLGERAGVGSIPEVEMAKVPVAVLNDYNGAAEQSTDWGRLAKGSTITFFKDRLADQQ